MPRLPIDYSRTIIYKLVHKDDLDDVNVYVGHTTDFTKRKNLHKDSCNSPSNKGYNQKKSQFIRENGGWDEWVMIKIEDYPCKDVHEAIQRERYWMKELRAKLNTTEPGRKIKEWREDNKEKIVEQRKQYRQNNKEKILEKNKRYNQNNKEKVAEINKEYRQNNKENILKYKRENYEKNKEKIAEHNREKVECDKCGCEITRGSLSRHKKSLKCQNHGSQ